MKKRPVGTGQGRPITNIVFDGLLEESLHEATTKTANGAMWLVKGAPDLMQRLPGLPNDARFVLLDSQKIQTIVLASYHTTFTEQPYIRWCCIDLSKALARRNLER
jgi:hypothetical protein